MDMNTKTQINEKDFITSSKHPPILLQIFQSYRKWKVRADIAAAGLR